MPFAVILMLLWPLSLFAGVCKVTLLNQNSPEFDGTAWSRFSLPREVAELVDSPVGNHPGFLLSQDGSQLIFRGAKSIC